MEFLRWGFIIIICLAIQIQQTQNVSADLPANHLQVSVITFEFWTRHFTQFTDFLTKLNYQVKLTSLIHFVLPASLLQWIKVYNTSALPDLETELATVRLC